MITYPLNNIDYTAEDAELYFSTRESGVYDGNDFEVTASSIDNDVIVGSGIAWIHNTKFSGKVVALKEPKTLTLSLPNSVYDRIDAIVIQFDANDNATDIIVKEGIASSSPVAPAVVRTESLYELHIFHVQRKAGATVISVDNLVDLRNDSNYCGIMFDPISSIDATLTKRGFAADAAETGKQIKRATNVRNLLDNSDFTNPVMEAGFNGWHGGTRYPVDRWYDRYGQGAFLKTNEGIVMSVNTGHAYLNQKIANADLLIDKRLTVAIGMFDGSIFCASGVFTKNGTSMLTQLYNDGQFIEVFDDMVQVVTTDVDLGIKWVALYEGEYTAETLPPYIPKGYAHELMECLRYCRKVNGMVCAGISTASGVVIITIPTEVTMRLINPTVMLDTSLWAYTHTGNAYALTFVEATSHNGGIELKFTSNGSSNYPVNVPDVSCLIFADLQ